VLIHNKPNFFVNRLKVELQILQKIFEDEGFQVLTASSGIEALKIIKKESPDLILLGIVIPGMNGYDVLKNIVIDEKTKHIPVIIVTEDIASEVIHKAVDIGAFDFLIKPIFKPELLEIVSKALHLKKIY